MSEHIRNIVKQVLEEIYQSTDDDTFVDKNGNKLITNKLVKKDNQKGQIKGITADSKVKVLWFEPTDIKGKTSPESPQELEVY